MQLKAIPNAVGKRPSICDRCLGQSGTDPFEKSISSESLFTLCVCGQSVRSIEVI